MSAWHCSVCGVRFVRFHNGATGCPDHGHVAAAEQLGTVHDDTPRAADQQQRVEAAERELIGDAGFSAVAGDEGRDVNRVARLADEHTFDCQGAHRWAMLMGDEQLCLRAYARCVRCGTLLGYQSLQYGMPAEWPNVQSLIDACARLASAGLTMNDMRRAHGLPPVSATPPVLVPVPAESWWERHVGPVLCWIGAVAVAVASYYAVVLSSE